MALPVSLARRLLYGLPDGGFWTGQPLPWAPMSEQIILTLRRLVKRYPPDRTVLDGITLAFLHGAKIGVLGANGSGKCSLLRIMAGIDTHVGGDVLLAPGATVGMLPQEPQLDETRKVYENVEDGMRATRDLLDRFNAISARLAEPLDADEMERTLAEMGRGAGAHRRDRRLEPRAHPRHRDGRPARAARRRRGRAPSPAASAAAWRCAGCCCSSPTCCCSTSRPTTSTPSRWPGWSASSQDYRGTVVAVTHDRYFLDNVAGWILELDRGRASRTRATTPAGSSRSRPGWRRRRRASRPASARSQRELEWVAHVAEGPPGQGQGALARATRSCWPKPRRRRRRRPPRDRRSPPATRLGRPGGRGDEPAQGLRRPAADRGSRLLPAARRDRRGDRPQRRRQDHAVPHDHGPGEARRRRAARRRRPSSSPTSTRSRDSLDGEKYGLRGDHRRRSTSIKVGNARVHVARLRGRASTSRAPTSRRRSATSRAASATACTWPSCCARAATCCCSTSPPTTSTSTRCGRSRTRSIAFAGCAVVISHDRWFLDRVATHILAFEGDSRCAWFEGNFDEYEADGARRWARTPAAPSACATSRSCATSAATTAGSDALCGVGRQPTAGLVCDTHAADRPHGGLPPRRPLREPRRPGAGPSPRRRA